MYEFRSIRQEAPINLSNYRPPAICWVVTEVWDGCWYVYVSLVVGGHAYSVAIAKAGKSIAQAIKEGRKMIRELRASGG